MKKTEFDFISNRYKETLKKSFPSILEEVDYFNSYKIKLIYKLTKNINQLNILDFGCGPGKSLNIFTKYFPKCNLWGYDVSKQFLKQIKNFSKIYNQTFNIGGGINNAISLKELTYFCKKLTGNTIKIRKKFKTQK